MPNETDNHAYDWRRWYADRSKWPATADIFLADAFCRLGTMMVFPFDDEIVAAADRKETQTLPSAEKAFKADGSPRSEIHDAWGPALLRRHPAEEFHSALLKNTDPDRWSGAHSFDPAEGVVEFDLTKAGVAPGTITRAHWETAELNDAYDASLREAATSAVPHVAKAFAAMALRGDVETVARPIDGEGGDFVLEPSHWEMTDPVARFATCGVDVASPRSTRRPPTHLVFVRRERFDTAAWIAARASPLSLIEGQIFPDDLDLVGPRPTKVNALLKERIYSDLRQHLLDNPDDYHRPKLTAIVTARHGRIGDKLFEQIRDRLRSEFPHITQGGSPIGKERR